MVTADAPLADAPPEADAVSTFRPFVVHCAEVGASPESPPLVHALADHHGNRCHSHYPSHLRPPGSIAINPTLPISTRKQLLLGGLERHRHRPNQLGVLAERRDLDGGGTARRPRTCRRTGSSRDRRCDRRRRPGSDELRIHDRNDGRDARGRCSPATTSTTASGRAPAGCVEHALGREGRTHATRSRATLTIPEAPSRPSRRATLANLRARRGRRRPAAVPDLAGRTMRNRGTADRSAPTPSPRRCRRGDTRNRRRPCPARATVHRASPGSRRSRRPPWFPSSSWTRSASPSRPQPGRLCARATCPRVGSNTPGLPTTAAVTCFQRIPASWRDRGRCPRAVR